MEPASYFPEAEPELAALLDGFLASLSEDLEKQPFRGSVRSVLLAGGYGRGEGGIFRESETGDPRLYNDLEFYLIIDDSTAQAPIEKWCGLLSHAGDAALGIEVEFKILRESAFLTAGPSMFYYDLLAAHRVVCGPRDFAAHAAPGLVDPEKIPSHEATRLLFNRGTGLFYSSIALINNNERVTNGFIERNHAKVRLALADAVLALNGRHHFSCRERHRRLSAPLDRTPPDWKTLVEMHDAGVEFKLRPRHLKPTVTEMRETQADLSRIWMNTFLWLESARLGVTFQDACAYAAHKGFLFPDTNPFRNLALHLRDRLKRGSTLPGWLDYPRAALQRALVLLLLPQPAFAEAGRFLSLKADASPGTIHDAYECWWKHYN